MLIVHFIYNENTSVPIYFKDTAQVDAAFEVIDEAQKANKRVAIFDAAYGKASVGLSYLAAFTRSEKYP